jgi:hypothetical protein
LCRHGSGWLRFSRCDSGDRFARFTLEWSAARANTFEPFGDNTSARMM